MCLQFIPNILGLTKKGLAFDDKLKLLEAAGAKVRWNMGKNTAKKNELWLFPTFKTFNLQDVAEMNVDGMER